MSRGPGFHGDPKPSDSTEPIASSQEQGKILSALSPPTFAFHQRQVSLLIPNPAQPISCTYPVPSCPACHVTHSVLLYVSRHKAHVVLSACLVISRPLMHPVPCPTCLVSAVLCPESHAACSVSRNLHPTHSILRYTPRFL